MRIGSLETEISERSAQVDALTAQLEEIQAEKSQLVQQVATINSLLEANQTKQEEDNNQVGQTLQAREWPHASRFYRTATLNDLYLSDSTGGCCRSGTAQAQVNVLADLLTKRQHQIRSFSMY